MRTSGPDEMAPFDSMISRLLESDDNRTTIFPNHVLPHVDHDFVVHRMCCKVCRKQFRLVTVTELCSCLHGWKVLCDRNLKSGASPSASRKTAVG